MHEISNDYESILHDFREFETLKREYVSGHLLLPVFGLKQTKGKSTFKNFNRRVQSNVFWIN